MKIDKLRFSLSVLLIFCILGVSVFPALEVKAAAATATLTINNSAPTVSSVKIYYSHDSGSTYTDATSGDFTVATGTTTKAKITFTVADNNGCEDIDSGSTKTGARFYRTDETSSCTLSSANCYTTASFTCTQDALSCTAGGADLDATYTCTADIQFYADATDSGSPNAGTTWTAAGVPADNAGASTQGTSTTEIDSLTSLSVTSSITYGSLSLNGNTGSTDQTTAVTNKGNRQINTRVGGYGQSSTDGYSMHCTVGNVAVALEKFATTASQDYTTAKTALNGDPSYNTVSNGINPGAASSSNIYWGMGLPANGVGGSCSGSVVFTPVNA